MTNDKLRAALDRWGQAIFSILAGAVVLATFTLGPKSTAATVTIFIIYAGMLIFFAAELMLLWSKHKDNQILGKIIKIGISMITVLVVAVSTSLAQHQIHRITHLPPGTTGS